MKQESSRPKTIHAELDQAKCEALRAMLHQSPRTDGTDTSVWTLELAAQVGQELGLTSRQVSIETIRLALKRLGVGWQRANHGITSPAPDDAWEKKRRDALITLAQRLGWAGGYRDEVCWSRVAQPNRHAWSEVKPPLRLVERQVSKEDPDPKALCCSGIVDAPSGQIRLCFVDGRPVSQVTTDFLEWLCQQSAAQGQRTLVLIWDNASWQVSKHVKIWLRQQHQAALQAQREGKPAVRLIPCWLPTKSPWLNRIEPHWVHGKRASVEPARLLTAPELIQRGGDYVGCEQVASLAQQAA